MGPHPHTNEYSDEYENDRHQISTQMKDFEAIQLMEYCLEVKIEADSFWLNTSIRHLLFIFPVNPFCLFFLIHSLFLQPHPLFFLIHLLYPYLSHSVYFSCCFFSIFCLYSCLISSSFTLFLSFLSHFTVYHASISLTSSHLFYFLLSTFHLIFSPCTLSPQYSTSHMSLPFLSRPSFFPSVSLSFSLCSADLPFEMALDDTWSTECSSRIPLCHSLFNPTLFFSYLPRHTTREM